MLDSSQVPRATAALNTLRQIGGSIGTALLAVVLQHEATAALPSARRRRRTARPPLRERARSRSASPLATAFGHTFMWAVAMSLLAMIPAVALLSAERASRLAGQVRPRRGRAIPSWNSSNRPCLAPASAPE